MAKIFILSGPSGVGKKTVRERVMKKIPELRYSISTTTRAPRNEDIEGVTYNFVAAEVFKSMIDANEFIEWSYHLDNYYGTPRRTVEEMLRNGESVLLEIETNGAKRVFELFSDAVGIFIVSDNLVKQLITRGTETEDQIQDRLKKAGQEMQYVDMYKYIVLNKYGDLDHAVAECEEIIRKELE